MTDAKKDTTEKKEIQVEDPERFAVEQVAKEAHAWVTQHEFPAGSKPILLYRPALRGLDLKTRENVLEIRGDLVDGRKAPLSSAKVIKRFYSSLKFRLPPPPEAEKAGGDDE